MKRMKSVASRGPANNGLLYHPHRRGVTAVEFAVVLPVILTIFFGCIEAVNVNHLNNMASDAAFYAARKAMVPGANKTTAINEGKALLSTVGINNPVITVVDTQGGTHVKGTCTLALATNSWGVSRFATATSITRSYEFPIETER